MGIATTNEEQRIEASQGLLECADTEFKEHNSVLFGGVLLSVPSLLSQGLAKAFETYKALPAGYYGIRHIVILMCFMALCRIKNVERLKSYPPGELGKLLGLDRVPEVGHLRKKLKQIFIQKKTDTFHSMLFNKWLEDLPQMYFYIDGHVRVYTGKDANLSKRYVSREKLCLSGTTEFWVNDEQGQPLMVITGELNEKLKEAVGQIIEKIKEEIPRPKDKTTPWFTLIVDRESYEPKWYHELWKKDQIAVITYRKNIRDKWEEDQFVTTDNKVLGNNVTMQICERGTQLNGHWFREIRSLSANGHQTSIITTQWQLNTKTVACKMFARWTQENYFKYMIENFDFDKMIEYGTEAINPDRNIVNPHYRQLSYQLKKLREKKRRKEAKVYEKIQSSPDQTIEQLHIDIANSSDLLTQIEEYNQQIIQLIEKRKNVAARINVGQMPKEVRYEKLKQESKKFKNAIIMIAYRAETALYNTLPNQYKNSKKDGRALLREIFTSEADLVPDYENKTLNLIIHSLSTPRYNEALTYLCKRMNKTQTIYPGTNLTLVFKSIAE